MDQLVHHPPRPDSAALEMDVALVKKRLRVARANLAISQRELADRAGISKSVVEKYESRDDLRIPNTKQMFRLAIVFGVSMDYLVGRTNDTSVRSTAVTGSSEEGGDDTLRS